MQNQVEITSFLNEENDVLVKLKYKKLDLEFKNGRQLIVMDRTSTILNLIYENENAKVMSEIIMDYKLTKIHRITKEPENYE